MATKTEGALGLEWGEAYGGANWNVWNDSNIVKIGATTQISVINKTTTAPPTIVEGNRYIVATGGTGAWAAKDGQLACAVDGAWVFYALKKGWMVHDQSDNSVKVWSGSAFVEPSAAAIAAAVAAEAAIRLAADNALDGRVDTLEAASNQAGLQFKDEGSNLGTAGTATTVDFTGAGVTASRAGNVVTVAVAGGGVDDAGIAVLIADDTTPSDTRAALDLVVGEVAYTGATLGTAIATGLGLTGATVTGNIITSSGSAQSAGLNTAVTKPVSGAVSMGEFRVDAGTQVQFVVVNAGGDGMIYECQEGQWSKTPITAGVPGSSTPLALGFGRTASVLLTSAGATLLVVEGSLFSTDTLFAANATINTVISMPGSAATVVYTTEGDKYIYSYTGLGVAPVVDALGRTIKPTGKIQSVGPLYPAIVPGSNPRTYVGFEDASITIDTKVKFESVNLNLGTVTYGSATNITTTALIIVGAGAVVNIDAIACGTADVSTVVAVEKGGIVTVGAVSGTGTITNNFNQAPMTETVDGFIRSALTQVH